MFTRLRSLLAGRKTYLLAVASILTALVAWADGNISNVQLIQAIYAALATITLRAGIAKAGPNLAPVLLAASLFLFPRAGAAAETAAQTPVTAPSIAGAASSTISSGLTKFMEWIEANGSQGQGYGWTLSGGKGGHGFLLKEGVSAWKFEFARSTVSLDVNVAHLFTTPLNHTQVGLSLTWTLLKTPALEEGKEATPVVRLLPFNLSEFRVSPYIGVDVDKLADGTFDRRWTVIGLTSSWKF